MAVASFGAGAATLYDMERFLGSSHPFAPRIASTQAPAVRPVPVHSVPARVMPVRVSPVKAARVRVAEKSSTRAGNSSGGWLSEIRLGALIHDEGPFSRNKESGFDGNLEVLFTSPDFLDAAWSPRPHVGLTANSDGNTSQVYAGLTWEWQFFNGGFFDFSLGGVFHNGETDQGSAPLDRKELGCSLLFRGSLDLGWRFDGGHALMVHLAHLSNAKLCDTNEGLETFGIRYGYSF